MPSCLVTELQLADPLVAALPPQIVSHHALPVNLFISISFRSCVLLVGIYYVPITYLAHLFALACKLLVLPDRIQM